MFDLAQWMYTHTAEITTLEKEDKYRIVVTFRCSDFSQWLLSEITRLEEEEKYGNGICKTRRVVLIFISWSVVNWREKVYVKNR